MSCKGCSRSIVASDAYIQKQIEEQLQLEIDLVDDSTYRKRLEICSACPSLLFSNTGIVVALYSLEQSFPIRNVLIQKALSGK